MSVVEKEEEWISFSLPELGKPFTYSQHGVPKTKDFLVKYTIMYL